MSYYKLKKQSEAQLLYNLAVDIDIETDANRGDILALLRSDSDYYYREMLQLALSRPVGYKGRADKISKNIKYLLAEVPLDLKKVDNLLYNQRYIASGILEEFLEILEHTRGDKSAFYTSLDLFHAMPDYAYIYLQKYKASYPLPESDARLVIEAQNRLVFDAKAIEEIEAQHYFETKEQLHNWLNDQLAPIADYDYIVDCNIATHSELFKVLKPFAKKDVYNNFYLAVVFNLLASNVDSFEEVYEHSTKILKTLSKMGLKPDIKSDFLEYLSQIFDTLKKSDVLALIDDPSKRLDTMKPDDADEVMKLEKMRINYSLKSKPKKAGILKL